MVCNPKLRRVADRFEIHRKTVTVCASLKPPRKDVKKWQRGLDWVRSEILLYVFNVPETKVPRPRSEIVLTVQTKSQDP